MFVSYQIELVLFPVCTQYSKHKLIQGNIPTKQKNNNVIKQLTKTIYFAFLNIALRQFLFTSKCFICIIAFFPAITIYVNILIRRRWGRTHRKHKDNLYVLAIYVNKSTIPCYYKNMNETGVVLYSHFCLGAVLCPGNN